MKTIELSAINVGYARRSSWQNLLCKALRSPIKVSISTTDCRLASIWRPARVLLEQHRMLDAIATLTEMIQQSEFPVTARIPTLFLLAQMHMENSDSISAEQCIQRGLQSLGRQIHTPRDWSDSVHDGNSAQSKIRPYSLGGREWLTLAIQSLTSGDVESSLRWIYQADRALSCSATKSEAQQIGDLHAVLACAMAQNDYFDEAERCMVAAYRVHLDAESYESVCRDLILTSRLAAVQGQTERAYSLLDAAECQLILALPQDSADRSPLTDIIRSDRYAESGCG